MSVAFYYVSLIIYLCPPKKHTMEERWEGKLGRQGKRVSVWEGKREEL